MELITFTFLIGFNDVIFSLKPYLCMEHYSMPAPLNTSLVPGSRRASDPCKGQKDWPPLGGAGCFGYWERASTQIELFNK